MSRAYATENAWYTLVRAGDERCLRVPVSDKQVYAEAHGERVSTGPMGLTMLSLCVQEHFMPSVSVAGLHRQYTVMIYAW